MPTGCARTSTRPSIKTSHPAHECRVPPARALLDTSVIVGLEQLNASTLPPEVAICTITLAELAAGPHATDDAAERARRQDRLQRVEALLDPLPFDAAAARAYGRVYAATIANQRKPRGARALDLLIAAVAIANDLAVITTNPTDFEHLGDIGLEVLEP